MSSIAAQYVVDNEQDKSVYTRPGPSGKVTGLALITRENIPYSENKKENLEFLKAEILIPHLSKEGRERLNDIIVEQGLTLEIDYIGCKEIKDYIKEDFSILSNGKVARLTIRGLSPEYSGINILSEVDNILGLPNYMSEKPHLDHLD